MNWVVMLSCTTKLTIKIRLAFTLTYFFKSVESAFLIKLYTLTTPRILASVYERKKKIAAAFNN